MSYRSGAGVFFHDAVDDASMVDSADPIQTDVGVLPRATFVELGVAYAARRLDR